MANGRQRPWFLLVLLALGVVVALPAIGMLLVAAQEGASGGFREMLRGMGCWGMVWLVVAAAFLISLVAYLTRGRRGRVD